jgi:hypothetical protein
VARPGDVLTGLSTTPIVRVALVPGYVWLGWHLFAR